MGLILSLTAITYGFNKLVDINKEINGRWFTYLSDLIQLWIRRKRNKTNRIVIHDVWKDEVRHSGIIPFDHEWTYDSPAKVSCLQLFQIDFLLLSKLFLRKQSALKLFWRKSLDKRRKSI